MTGRLAFSPFAFFPFKATTQRMPQLWLILPEAGHKDLDLSSRNEGLDLFSPTRKARLLAEDKKGSFLLILLFVAGLRLRARSPLAVDRHRGCDGRGLNEKNQGE